MDRELELLLGQVRRKTKLTELIIDLHRQEQELVDKAARLQENCRKEQSDVDRMEKQNILAYFQTVTGTRDKKLEKERREALEALAKYNLAVMELEDVRKNIRQCEMELSGLAGCEERYEGRLSEKKRALEKSGSENGQKLLEMEHRLAEVRSQQAELQEAIEAGSRAMATVGEIQESLETAKNWSTYDLLGGSVIADVVKHNHMDQAQKRIEKLQLQLGRFKTELSDVEIQANLKVNIEGFERYIDMFLDNFFTDWEIFERIKRSQQQVDEVKDAVSQVLARLKEMKRAATDEEISLGEGIENLISQC